MNQERDILILNETANHTEVYKPVQVVSINVYSPIISTRKQLFTKSSKEFGFFLILLNYYVFINHYAFIPCRKFLMLSKFIIKTHATTSKFNCIAHENGNWLGFMPWKLIFFDNTGDFLMIHVIGLICIVSNYKSKKKLQINRV